MTVNLTPGCWIAQNVIGCGPCDGRLVRAHLIKKQTIRREVGPEHVYVWDYRVWVPACGGPTGVGGHHGQLDHSRSLRIPRDVIPVMVEEFAAEHGLVWWLEREYGERSEEAA